MHRALGLPDHKAILQDDDPEPQLEIVQGMVAWAQSQYEEGSTVPIIIQAPTHGILAELVVALRTVQLVAGVVFLSGGYNLKSSLMDLEALFGNVETKTPAVIGGSHFLVDVNRFLFVNGNKAIEDPVRNTANMLSPDDIKTWQHQHPSEYASLTAFARKFNMNLIKPTKVFRVDKPDKKDPKDYRPGDQKVRDRLDEEYKAATDSVGLSRYFQTIQEVTSLEQVKHEKEERKMTDDEISQFQALRLESEVSYRRALVEGGWRPCIKDQKGGMVRIPGPGEPFAIDVDIPLADVYIPLVFHLLTNHPDLVTLKKGVWQVKQLKFGPASSVAEGQGSVFSPHLLVGEATEGPLFDFTQQVIHNFLMTDFV
jgi:hypothetical protein